MGIEFRRAVREDCQDLISVQNESFLDDFKAYGECPAYNEPISQMMNSIDHHLVYAIVDGEIVVGDIIIKKKDQNTGYLRVLCVIPSYHNQKIGQRAIDFIERDNPEIKTWELITPFKSYRNHYFYEKMGYCKVGEFKHSDVLVMYRYKKVVSVNDRN